MPITEMNELLSYGQSYVEPSSFFELHITFIKLHEI